MKKALATGRRQERGFSLAEAMVAMFISMFVMAAFYFLYNHQKKQALSEQNVSDLQAEIRFILDSMDRDLILAGYKPAKDPGISVADSHVFEFEYLDEKTVDDGTYDRHRRIKFDLPGGARLPLRRTVKKFNTSTNDYDSTGQSYTIGEYLQDLNFEYFDQRNVQMTAPVDAANLKNIRAIRVTVKVRSSGKDTMIKPAAYKYLTTTRTYQARNLGLASSPVDWGKPTPPTGVMAIDHGRCGELEVSWTTSTAPDLAGYYIYYGLVSGQYHDKVRVSSPGATSYTLTGLTSTTSTGPAVTYYIALKSYDKSANLSDDYSNEAAGNPTPSVDRFSDVASKGSDTTINPFKPLPPNQATFEARDGTIEGQASLTWSPRPASEGIAEYHLHRSKTAGFTPEDGNRIAVLPSTASSYTDSGLLGCTTYYYKICSVNCDPTLVPAYTETEYSQCYGDGTLTGEGHISVDFPTVNVTDSTPFDITPIDNYKEPGHIYKPVPQISSIPGWHRVFLSLENPNRTDDPDFDRTEIWFNSGSGGFPQILPGTCNVNAASGSKLLPNDGGVFTVEGGGTSRTHVKESPADADEPPSLLNSTTYYYLAVSYDKCGNCTSVTEEATTLSDLCGDDPVGLPQCDPAIWLYARAEGCSGYAQLTWDGDCLKAGTPTNYDFSGFHVFRVENSSYSDSDPTRVELTNGVPQWFQTFTDATVEEGKTYAYAVKWADCAYEHGSTAGNISNPYDNGGMIYNVAVGRLLRDGTAAVTGDVTLAPPTYEHNIVKFYLKNTSAAYIYLNSLDLKWDNPLAYLQKIIVGDNDTTYRVTAWEQGTLPLTISSSGATINLFSQVSALDTLVPVELYFANADGSVDANCDMREDTVRLSLTYMNMSTYTTGCASLMDVTTPVGPTITRVTQTKPSVATLSWPVPGYGGTNAKDQIVVQSNTTMDVNATISSAVSLSSVTLYYFADHGGMMPEAPTYDGTNYTAVPMSLVSGNLYRTSTPLPILEDSSVWFFIIAVDLDGNFDREPEKRGGSFQYYQQPADVCENYPNPPVLAGEASTSGVFLSWMAPTQNSNGTELKDLEGYLVFRTDGASWSQLAELDAAVTGYADNPGSIDTSNYSYYVIAYDGCNPTPKQSTASNVFSECIGAPPSSLIAYPTTLRAGDSFNLNLTACGQVNGIPYERLWVQDCSAGTGDADPIRMVESEDSGSFGIDTGYYSGRNNVRTWLSTSYPSPAANLDLMVNNGDTVTVKAYSVDSLAPLGWDDYCQSDSAFTNLSSAVLVVQTDPCLNPLAPAAPGSLTLTAGNCNSTTETTLSWTAPVQSPTAGPVSYYSIYRCTGAACTPSASPIAQVTATSYTDVAPGKLNKNVYRYRVTAVNAACATQIKESLPTAIVNDPCP